MSDLISKEQAIKAMQESEFGFTFEVDVAIEAVKALPTVEPDHKWTPVTEALPKEKEMVLITNNKGHVRCGQYQRTFGDENYRWWWKHNTLQTVIAWMPLPEAYKGD